MHAFLKNCIRDYDDEIELQADELAMPELLLHCDSVLVNRQIQHKKKMMRERSHSPTCLSQEETRNSFFRGERGAFETICPPFLVHDYFQLAEIGGT